MRFVTNFLHEMFFYFFGAFIFKFYSLKIFIDQKTFKGCLVNVLAKIITRGGAVQIFPNFPAKRLSIYRKRNCYTFLLVK